MIVLVMVLATMAPALAGTVTEFTDGSEEVGLVLMPGVPDNSTRIAFPTDSRVRQASVTLRTEQELVRTQVQADGGNLTVWSSTPSSIDLSMLDVEAFKGTPFTNAEMTRIALNTTSSAKTTVSSNASAHLFAYNVSEVLEGSARDIRITLDWTGMGKRMGTVAVDMVDLYIADFSMGRWHGWDEFSRVPSTGEQRAFDLILGPHSGWTDDDGTMYVLAAARPLDVGTGSSMTTSHVLLQVWTSQAPEDLAVDVGEDGTTEFSWNGSGVGLYGLQNTLEDGTDHIVTDLSSGTEHINLTSFLVPAGAGLVDAKVGLAGQPGDVVTSGPDQPAYVAAHGMTANTKVSGIPEYSDPTWAQVVMTNLKNAGMKDQAQETLRNSQTIGDYGGLNSSVSQTFVPSITGKLIFINLSIVGYVYDIPPNILVEIRTVDPSGKPNITVLGSSWIDGALLNSSSTNWHVVYFDEVQLSQGIQYAIVCSVPQAGFMEYYEWKNNFIPAGDPYSDGQAYVDGTHNGSGPWFEVQDTDQAFITYMETDIGAGVNLVKVAGNSFSEVRQGPSGDEYVFNVSGVTKDASGIWAFAITNANPFPVTFNWSAEVHSDTYPQLFGLILSTEAGSTPYYTYSGTNTSLDGYRWLAITTGLEDILDGAPVAYTAPNGVEFLRVDVTVNGSVAGGMVLSGLRVRYYLDIEITGPEVAAAADAYRAAHENLGEVEVPIAVGSSVSASVLLSGPFLEYDLQPTFVTKTQVIDEDGYGDEDLDTLFGDDYDNNALDYSLVSVSVPAALTTEIEGNMLKMTPAPNWTGELDIIVRGTDSSSQYVDGSIRVVIEPINDPPFFDIPDTTFDAQAKQTLILDLSPHILDVDNESAELNLTVNTSSITVQGLTLYCTFDEQGTYSVLMTVSDGVAEATQTITFIVTPPVGFPSIVGFPATLKVPVNRPLPMDLKQYGHDDEDQPGALTWSVEENSPYFNAVVATDGFNLTVTPTGTGLGKGIMTLELTDTDGNSVTQNVEVNVSERQKDEPRINHDALPKKITLEDGGDPYVLELAAFVEDDTPVRLLLVVVSYSVEGKVYVDAQNGNLSFVPKEVGKTNVTVTLTNADGLDSSFSVDVEVESVSEDEPINWTLWIVLLLVIVLILVVVAWPRRPTGDAATPSSAPRIVDEEVVHAPPAPRVDKVVPHTFRSSSLRALEEVLLFHSGGLLVSQYTRVIKEGVDKDLEGAVINAVQEHIRGRMRSREEPTDLIELEGMRVVIERGADVAIAAVLSGEEPESLRMHLRRTLNEIQTRNAGALEGWDGNLAELRGVDNAMVGLVEALIKEHNGAQDLSVDGEVVDGEPRPGRAVVTGVPQLEDQEDPLKLVKDIIGEEKAHEIEEGHHHEGP